MNLQVEAGESDAATVPGCCQSTVARRSKAKETSSLGKRRFSMSNVSRLWRFMGRHSGRSAVRSKTKGV